MGVVSSEVLPNRVGWGRRFRRLIATQPLIDFWEANRTKRDGVLFDLPAGRTTLKRVRRRLGFHNLDDISEFWNERIEDLEELSAREFAIRHEVDIQVVFDTRRKLLGKRARDPGWWRKPRPLKILRSKITLREMGEKLDISITQAKRLRDRSIPAIVASISTARSGHAVPTQRNTGTSRTSERRIR